MEFGFYAYKGIKPLGQEGLGSEGRMIVRDLKTVKGVINRIPSTWYDEGFSIYSFTNFYRDSTFNLEFKRLPNKS